MSEFFSWKIRLPDYPVWLILLIIVAGLILACVKNK